MVVIKKLSQDTISQIVPGEVIDRPASVVKELIENSIDAGATYIKLNLKDSGLKKIVVADDGLGMTKQDLELCLVGHATSKVFSPSDIVQVSSFGFRGEALASIAAVSKITIASRPRHQRTGYRVTKSLGQQGELESTGLSKGTIVTVENLFNRSPDKQRFFRSTNIELRYITRFLTQLAFARPKVGIKMSSNKGVMLDMPANQTLYQRINYLLGSSLTTHLRKISFQADYLKLNGFISNPGVSIKSRQNQYIFVNGRPVMDPSISRAVKIAYQGLLEKNAHPAYVLFLDLPNNFVNANVHPRKESVIFADPKLIMEFVVQAIRENLSRHKQSYGSTLSARNDQVQKSKQAPTIQDQQVGEGILQLNKSYILVKFQTGLYIVDQQAAHERIIFEQLVLELGESPLPNTDSEKYKSMVSQASKSAIKVGESLTTQQMKQLLGKLWKTPNNQTSPTGRKIIKKIDWQEVDDWFGRR